MGDIKPDVVANDRFHAILQEALEVYKTRTGHDLDNDKEIQKWRDMSTAEGLLQAVDEIPDRFKKSRDKYKETRKILKACVRPIQVVGSNATSALSLTPFPPAATLFRAGIFLIDACDNVSKAYDCIAIKGHFLEKVAAILSLLLEVFGQCEKVIKSSRFFRYWNGMFGSTNGMLSDSLAKLDKEFTSEEQLSITQILLEVKRIGLKISEMPSQQDQDNRQRQAKLQADINSISLGPIDIATKQADECRKSEGSTPKWIDEDETYQSWLDGTTAAYRWLWGFGNSGAGKTSLVSYLTKAWQSCTKLSESAGRSIHYVNGQLLQQLQKLNRDGAEKRVKQVKELNSDGANAALNWTVILDNVISEFQQTFIVVDALDENESGYGELILRLSRLTSQSLKLFVTSRDELSMQADAKSRGALDLTIRATDEFIEAYVDARFSRIENRDETSEPISRASALPLVLKNQKREITKKVVNAAGGNFYCAELQITSLKAEKEKENVESKLKVLPRFLEDVIREAIDRINKQNDRDSREIGRQTLMWATYAGRTLTIEEIQHAIALSIRPYALEDPESHQIEVERLPRSTLLESSRYFLKVDNQTTAVQVHKAIKDYCDYANIFEDAHSQMAEICLAFLDRRFFALRCSSKEEYDTLKQENPFYEYAARHWGFHMKRAGERRFLGPTSPVSMATLFNRRLFVNSVAVALHEDLQNLRMWNWLHDTWKGLSDSARPVLWPMHLLIYFDLQQTADWWLRQNRDEVDKPSQTGTRPLYLACSLGRVRMVEIILFDYGASSAQKGANPALKGAEPAGYNLAAAVFAQSPAIVERLLYISAKELLPQTNWHGKIALGEAVARENKDIIRMIVNAISTMPNGEALITYRERNDDWNALHEAAKVPHPSPSVLELLVKAKGGKGLLQQKTKNWGDTPLHIAAVKGRTVAVRSLLDLGADPMDRQIQGKTPLHLACQGISIHNAQTINLLLGKTDKLAKDNAGLTTWHLAAMHGRPENLRLLIQKTPETLFNVKNKNKMIPIRVAANCKSNDWLGCIDVLLELCPGEIVTEDAYVILNTLIFEHNEVSLRALRRLLEHPVEPWPLHREKTTILHRIVHRGTLEGAKTAWELLGSKEVLEYRDAGGSTALVLASHLCTPEKAEFLINVGADVNAQDDTGRTALHYAIERDMSNLAGKLLEKHADYHIKDSNGVEALDRASAQNSCRKIWQARYAKLYGSNHSQCECVRNKKAKRHHVVGCDETRNEQLGRGISPDAIDVTRAEYLRSDPIPPDAKLPVIRVEISVTWQSSGVNEGDDKLFGIGILGGDRVEERQHWFCRCCEHAEDGKETQTQTITWHLMNGFIGRTGLETEDGKHSQAKEFVRSLGIGDRIIVVALAAGLGTVNVVEEAEVKVYYED
ncbi:MAG: hypothetical protein L6R42_001543 [Xanthoria sp. 1 TBL-2021]|nr:MAG: hypothetical protein L6R42_001543 [Xanthoria sp. 1 TBL-2021]